MFLGGVCDFKIQIMGYGVESNRNRNVVRDCVHGDLPPTLNSDSPRELGMLAGYIAAAVRGMPISYLTRWLENKISDKSNETSTANRLASENE